MGSAASVDEREDGGGVMQLLGLKPKELAARALAEGKDPVVAKTIRKHKLTAAKAVDLDEEDVDKFVEQSNNKLLTIQSVMYLNELLISINFSKS